MNIKNHRLFREDGTQYPYRLSPNGRGTIDHRFLIIHYTAGRSAESSVNWLLNPDANASAHLVIGRDGSITQLRPFNLVAWHAGTSEWGGLTGLNAFSIGIELDNAGRMLKQGDKWAPWFGDIYPDEEVVVAKHKNEDFADGWHIYTPIQLEVCAQVSALLVEKYELKEVLGHDDVSPFRKADPGPAFPMGSFRAKVMGRKDDEPTIFETTATLNIREGAGSQFSTLPEAPLPQGTKVDILRLHRSWRFVDVLDEVKGVHGIQGWVHGRYLREVAAS